MARVSARAARAPRVRAQRTLVQKLGSIVLGFEAVGALLAGLVIFGLDALPAGIPSWWGIVDELLPQVTEVFATAPDSDRAADADAIADLVEERGRRASVHPTLADAVDAAREWAASADRRAVVIAGSIVLAGEALLLSEEEDWKSGWRA